MYLNPSLLLRIIIIIIIIIPSISTKATASDTHTASKYKVGHLKSKIKKIESGLKHKAMA